MKILGYIAKCSLAGLGLLAVSLFLISCSGEHLEELKKFYIQTLSYIRVEANVCATEPQPAKQKVKYLFIVDQSDSNQPGIPSVPGDINNTDPQGSRRFGPMIQFLRRLNLDANQQAYFNLIEFNDNAAAPRSPNYLNGFDSDRANFESVVNSEWIGTGSAASPQPRDRGFTNFVSPLQMALNTIRNDAQLEAGSLVRPIIASEYRIIFVSDGEPKISTGSGLYTQLFSTDILPQINSILSLKSDPILGAYIADIVLNTAYYFNASENAAAEALLEQMATAGNGQFLKFGASANLQYGAFAPPPVIIRPQVTDIFLDNPNVVWWDDGQLRYDGDQDGLPDFVEDSAGSDSQKRDSDGNGVSDLVEYRLKGQPCQGPHCEAALRNPFSVCDGFSPAHDGAGNVIFPDTDRDSLNDCEEFLLRADRNKFDTNGDFIPDFISLKAAIPFIQGVDGSYAQPQGDGLSNYEKAKMGLPIQVPVDKVSNFRSRRTSLLKLERKEGEERDCYQVSIDPVAVLGPNNTIRMYLVENSTIIEDKPRIRVAEKIVEGNSKRIVLTDGDFK